MSPAFPTGSFVAGLFQVNLHYWTRVIDFLTYVVDVVYEFIIYRVKGCCCVSIFMMLLCLRRNARPVMLRTSIPVSCLERLRAILALPR